MKKCIIFGASGSGKNALKLLQKTKTEYQMIGFSDNNAGKWGTFLDGYPIYPPDELLHLQLDCIVIASVYYSEIEQQLKMLSLGQKELFLFYDLSFGNGEKQYELLQLRTSALFTHCQYSNEFTQQLQNNFSLNYTDQKDQGEAEMHRVIKSSGKKTVLFVAYYFPPIGGSGVQRSLYFVKHLSKFGYHPIVLTVQDIPGYPHDHSHLQEIDEDIPIIRIPVQHFLEESINQTEEQELFNLYGGIVQSAEWMESYKKYTREENDVLIPDHMIIWVNECLKRIEQLIDLQSIDLMFTTSGPCSAHILGYYLKKKYGMKWVMDYRDPWCTNNYAWYVFSKRDNIRLHLEQTLEKECLDFSDAVITDAETEIYKYEQTYKNIKPPIIAIMNGYEESNFENLDFQKEKLSYFSMCFNGQLYGDRNPLVILHAVNQLIEDGFVNANEIKWIINGRVSAPHLQLIKKADKYGIVTLNGYLEHHHSIVSAMNSDLLVLLGAESDELEAGFSGKFFEYLRMGIPILALSTIGGECEKILKTTGTGENFSYSDRKGIEKCILKHYRAWQSGETLYQGITEEIQKHSRENRTRQLATVFEQVLNEKQIR